MTEFLEKNFNIQRYDLSCDKSLRAWNAADEYLLQLEDYWTDKETKITLYNDRFGYLTCHLNAYQATTICTQKSQMQAIQLNLESNKLNPINFSNPLTELDTSIGIALVKIPKSLDLFRLFLEHISRNSTDSVTILCGFMTRHFSPKILEIAEEYFEEVSQSRAVKKARLLTLSKKKTLPQTSLLKGIQFKNQIYQQYLGVFSANHIDYATQFFLEHFSYAGVPKTVLDLASGNGIIASRINQQYPNSKINLLDDSYLAIESGKLNLIGANVQHHWHYNLDIFEENAFDLIVSNPPFHFEYEVNMNITLNLFKNCLRCLKEGGELQLVANRHLNYKAHLERLFKFVEIVAENKKFVVYRCVK